VFWKDSDVHFENACNQLGMKIEIEASNCDRTFLTLLQGSWRGKQRSSSVASAAFLALAILDTKCKKAERWIDPSMALTFHGLKQDSDSTARVNKTSHMKLVARGMKCYIGANGRGELELLRSR
jgi:hypothetical protein